jgi:hypothetical protein
MPHPVVSVRAIEAEVILAWPPDLVASGWRDKLTFEPCSKREGPLGCVWAQDWPDGLLTLRVSMSPGARPTPALRPVDPMMRAMAWQRWGYARRTVPTVAADTQTGMVYVGQQRNGAISAVAGGGGRG